MPKRIALPLLLVLVASVYFYTARDVAILDDGDALYAHVAQNMLQSGDWTTPVANGARFLDKPPMMYWLMALSYKIFGVDEFAARFPSALAVLGISILVFLLGKKAAGESAGFIAGGAMAFCIGTFLFTRMVFPDILFVFVLTAALYFFLRWHSDKTNPVLPAMLFHACLAAAVLTKGLIGLVFPCAVAALFLLWSKSFRRLRHFHIGAGLPLFLGLALPWHILAARSNPGFLWYFFINEQALRFLGRRQPVDYESISLPIFWALILIWLFPWSVFLPAARQVLGTKEEPARDTVRLCAIWSAVILVFFSFSSRIEHYSLPMLPPLAILIAVAISPVGIGETRRERKRQIWTARGFLWLGVIGIILGAALVAISAAWLSGFFHEGADGAMDLTHLRAYKYYFAPLFDFPPHLLARLRLPLLETLAALSIGLIAAWRLNRRGRRIAAVLAVWLAMTVFSLATFQSFSVCQEILSSRQFGKKLMEIYAPGDLVVTVGDYETANSINFYAPTPLYVYQGSAALLEWGLKYPDAPSRVLDERSLQKLWSGDSRAFILSPENRLAKLELGSSHAVLRSSGRILICNKPVAAEER